VKWHLSIVRLSALLFGALLFWTAPLFAQPPAQATSQEPGGIAETLPSAETVVVAFSTDGERVAALQILMEQFEFSERSSAAQAKRTEYMRAIDKISPPTTLNAELSRETRALRQSAEFRFDVIRRFAPALAGEAQGAVMQQQFEASNENSLFMFWVSVAGVCLVALAIPVVYAMRNQHSRAVPVNADPAFQLPQPLADAKTLGRTYGLAFDCGTFLRSADGSPFFRTPDGRETPAPGFDAEPGDIVSTIHSGTDAVLYYNNTRATDWFFLGTIEEMSGIPFVPLELASFGFVVAGFTVISYTTLVGAREVNSMLPSALAAWGLLMVFGTYYFTRILNVRLTGARVRRFERKWKPRLLAFMQERGSQIMQAHAQPGSHDRRLNLDGGIVPAR
jgi:hypothetical protein